MAFKKLTSAEINQLNEVELESYLSELSKHEPFDKDAYLEKHPTSDYVRPPSYRPSLIDEENPDSGFRILGATVAEVDRAGLKAGAIVEQIREWIATEPDPLGVIGFISPIDRICYEKTIEGVTGYGDMIRNYFTLNPNRYAFRFLNAKLTSKGIFVDFIPEGPCASVLEQWLEDETVSFRMYMRVGLNTSLEPQLITFDIDREITLP
ncbi:hypothetical protein [Vibrio phage phiKT1028]|nr:hypothetical protein [Vibrio phage phiKT1028]